jgi:hypothetical protein
MGCTITETTLSGNGSSEIGLDERSGKRTYQVEYEATTPPANLVAVETASGTGGTIPARRSALPGDATRICKRVSVKPRRGTAKLVYDVECSYEKFTPGEEIEDPLARPDTVSFEGSSEYEPIFVSEDEPALLIATSAGEPFDPLPERGTGTFKIVIEGNRASLDLAARGGTRISLDGDGRSR